MSSKSSVHFTNASNGAPIELEPHGDWFDGKADISLAGRPVAQISRDFMNFGHFMSDGQTVSHALLRP